MSKISRFDYLADYKKHESRVFLENFVNLRGLPVQENFVEISFHGFTQKDLPQKVLHANVSVIKACIYMFPKIIKKTYDFMIFKTQSNELIKVNTLIILSETY